MKKVLYKYFDIIYDLDKFYWSKSVDNVYYLNYEGYGLISLYDKHHYRSIKLNVCKDKMNQEVFFKSTFNDQLNLFSPSPIQIFEFRGYFRQWLINKKIWKKRKDC